MAATTRFVTASAVRRYSGDMGGAPSSPASRGDGHRTQAVGGTRGKYHHCWTIPDQGGPRPSPERGSTAEFGPDSTPRKAQRRGGRTRQSPPGAHRAPRMPPRRPDTRRFTCSTIRRSAWSRRRCSPPGAGPPLELRRRPPPVVPPSACCWTSRRAW